MNTFQAPTEHYVSDIELGEGTVSFSVLFRARTKDNTTVEANVREDWRFDLRADGRPLMTHYAARV